MKVQSRLTSYKPPKIKPPRIETSSLVLFFGLSATLNRGRSVSAVIQRTHREPNKKELNPAEETQKPIAKNIAKHIVKQIAIQ
jgi:hypothetical protein